MPCSQLSLALDFSLQRDVSEAIKDCSINRCLFACIAEIFPLIANYDRIVNPAAELARYNRIAGDILRKEPGRMTIGSLCVDGGEVTIVVRRHDSKPQDTERLESKLQQAPGL